MDETNSVWTAISVAPCMGAAWAFRRRYGIGWALAAAFWSVAVAMVFTAFSALLAIIYTGGLQQAGEQPGYGPIVFVVVLYLCGALVGVILVAAARRMMLARRGDL